MPHPTVKKIGFILCLSFLMSCYSDKRETQPAAGEYNEFASIYSQVWSELLPNGDSLELYSTRITGRRNEVLVLNCDSTGKKYFLPVFLSSGFTPRKVRFNIGGLQYTQITSYMDMKELDYFTSSLLKVVKRYSETASSADFDTLSRRQIWQLANELGTEVSDFSDVCGLVSTNSIKLFVLGKSPLEYRSKSIYEELKDQSTAVVHDSSLKTDRFLSKLSHEIGDGRIFEIEIFPDALTDQQKKIVGLL